MADLRELIKEAKRRAGDLPHSDPGKGYEYDSDYSIMQDLANALEGFLDNASPGKIEVGELIYFEPEDAP